MGLCASVFSLFDTQNSEHSWLVDHNQVLADYISCDEQSSVWKSDTFAPDDDPILLEANAYRRDTLFKNPNASLKQWIAQHQCLHADPFPIPLCTISLVKHTSTKGLQTKERTNCSNSNSNSNSNTNLELLPFGKAEYMSLHPMEQIFYTGFDLASNFFYLCHPHAVSVNSTSTSSQWAIFPYDQVRKTSKGSYRLEYFRHSTPLYKNELTVWKWFTRVLFEKAPLSDKEVASIPVGTRRYMETFYLPRGRFASCSTPFLSRHAFLEMSPFDQILYAGFSVAKLYHDIVSARKQLAKSTFFLPSDHDANMLPRQENDNIACQEKENSTKEWRIPEVETGWVCEILPGKLYFGPTPVPVKHFWGREADAARFIADSMLSFGITHQLDLTNDADLFPGQKDCQAWPHIPCTRMPVDEYDVKNRLQAIVDKMHEILENPSPSTPVLYVHCVGGIHRSAAAVFGYLIRHAGMNLFEARRFMYKRRPTSRILQYLDLFEQWNTEIHGNQRLVSLPNKIPYFSKSPGSDTTDLDSFEALLDHLPELRALCGRGKCLQPKNRIQALVDTILGTLGMASSSSSSTKHAFLLKQSIFYDAFFEICRQRPTSLPQLQRKLRRRFKSWEDQGGIASSCNLVLPSNSVLESLLIAIPLFYY